MNIFTTVLSTSLFLLAGVTQAAATDVKRTPFTGTDISGVYACVGNDAHDGDFADTMTVVLDRQYSSGKFGSFKVTVQGEHDSYSGAIVSDGKQLAMDFANNDVSKKDFGVTLATLSSLPKHQFKIEKFYYQPQYMGGSNGFETCTKK